MEGKVGRISRRGSPCVGRKLVVLLSSALMLAMLASGCRADDKPAAPIDWAKRAKEVCHDDKKFQVQSISEMSMLIAAVNRDDLVCKSSFKSAIYELDPILKLPRDSLCGERAFALIKDYHFRSIQPFRRVNRRPTQFEAMPRELVKEQLHPEPRKYTVEFDEHNQVLLAPMTFRHFFLKFALQVSYVCKKDLINNLDADAKRVLTDQDREIMEMFDRGSPIGDALAEGIEKMDFDSVLYIPELDGRRETATGKLVLAEGREQHLKTNAQADSVLFQMIYACKHRFKPIYEKLIMPIVRLSKLGYDYQGKSGFTDREREFLTGEKMKQWLVVVHVCEIFKNTHLIRAEPKPKEKSLSEHLNEIEEHDDKHEELAQRSATQAGEVPAQEEEGVLSAMTDEEVREAAEKEELEAEWLKMFDPIEYEPTVRNEMPERLMIETERQLEEELAKKYGGISANGFFKFLRIVSNKLKRSLANLDLEKFAHYRRNSLMYAGLLNFLSACSNVASITVTLGSTFGWIG